MSRDAIAITGATASGKTALAIAVAQRVDGEIISFDSRQVYRGMDIGTAKPAMVERDGIAHHGFDVVSPEERFNAGRFARLARDWMDEIRGRGRVPVLAGGTGFFLRALTHPMFEEPRVDAALREQWKRYLEALPTEALARWADTLDPGNTVGHEDRQRLARVIEVAMLTGRTLAWLRRHAPPAAAGLDPLVIVLTLDRQELVRRIEERVDRMVDEGLVEEVRRLMDAGHDERDPGMNATGYMEMVPHVRGERSLVDAVTDIKAATRRYARRQRTWFRNQLPPDARWLDATRPRDALADEIARIWTEENE
ncbi:MAG: tRNA (adenosine(37)-N6)-dimethylallyltransferase MiaA [Gemmatimonadota bacterium]